MGVLVWWLLPLLATVVAIAWLWWQGRTGASQPGQVRSTKELDRMRKAIEKPLPKRPEPPAADQIQTGANPAESRGESLPTDSQSGAA